MKWVTENNPDSPQSTRYSINNVYEPYFQFYQNSGISNGNNKYVRQFGGVILYVGISNIYIIPWLVTKTPLHRYCIYVKTIYYFSKSTIKQFFTVSFDSFARFMHVAKMLLNKFTFCEFNEVISTSLVGYWKVITLGELSVKMFNTNLQYVTHCLQVYGMVITDGGAMHNIPGSAWQYGM